MRQHRSSRPTHAAPHRRGVESCLREPTKPSTFPVTASDVFLGVCRLRVGLPTGSPGTQQHGSERAQADVILRADHASPTRGFADLLSPSAQTSLPLSHDGFRPAQTKRGQASGELTPAWYPPVHTIDAQRAIPTRCHPAAKLIRGPRQSSPHGTPSKLTQADTRAKDGAVAPMADRRRDPPMARGCSEGAPHAAP